MRTRIDWKQVVPVRRTRRQEVEYKPIGLWYSVDGDWERWCEVEKTDWLEGQNVHEVMLGREKMLYVRTVEEIDAFHARYKAKKACYYLIDWSPVALEYDGIEIAPYQWERRHDKKRLWYYTWDCASGCIWRPRGVTVKLIGKVPKVEVVNG